VSREQIERVLPFLTRRDAYPAFDVKMRICRAFRAVRGSKKGRVFTPKVQRDELLKTAEALGVIERAKSSRSSVPPILSQVSVVELRRQREFLSSMAQALPPPRKEGGKRNLGREIAVCEAYRLLISFGDTKRPGRTRGGPWNVIANILYEDPDADLFKTMEKFSHDEIILDSDRNDFDLDVLNFRTRTEQK